MYRIVYLLTYLSANEIYTKLPNLGVDVEAGTEQTKVLEEEDEESKLEQMEKRILEALRESDQEIARARFYSILGFTAIVLLGTVVFGALMRDTTTDGASLKSVLAEAKKAAGLATYTMTKLDAALGDANCSLTGLNTLCEEMQQFESRLDNLERLAR